jgi:hypothetical protein
MKTTNLPVRVGLRWGWLRWLTPREQRRRERAPRIASRVELAEPRILLSAVTASDDLIRMKNVGGEAIINVTGNDLNVSSITSVGATSAGSTRIVQENGRQLVGFTVSAGFTGNASFSYTVSGAGGTSSTATVSLVVQAGNLPSYSIQADTGVASVTTYNGYNSNTDNSDIRTNGGLGDYKIRGVTNTSELVEGITTTKSNNWTWTINSFGTYSESFASWTTIDRSGSGIEYGSGYESFSYTATDTGQGDSYSINASWLNEGYTTRQISTEKDGEVIVGTWFVEDLQHFYLSRTRTNSNNTFSATGGTSLSVTEAMNADGSTGASIYRTMENGYQFTGILHENSFAGTSYSIQEQSGVKSGWSSESYSLQSRRNGGAQSPESPPLDEYNPHSTQFNYGEFDTLEVTTTQTSVLSKRADGTWIGVSGSGSGSVSSSSMRSVYQAETTINGFWSGSDAPSTTSSKSTGFSITRNQSTQTSWQEQMAADGEFYKTSGSGTGISTGTTPAGAGESFWGIVGSLENAGQSVGVFRESSYQYETTTRLVAGFWLTSGSGHSTVRQEEQAYVSGSRSDYLPSQPGFVSYTSLSFSQQSVISTTVNVSLQEGQSDWIITGGFGNGYSSSYKYISYNGSGLVDASAISGSGNVSGGATNPSSGPQWSLSIWGYETENAATEYGLVLSTNSSSTSPEWVMSSGTGYVNSEESENSQYNTQSSLTSSSGGWNITQNVSASGSTTKYSTSNANLYLVDGDWVTSGTGTISEVSEMSSTVNGSGTYASTTASTTATTTSSGTLHSSGWNSSDYEYSANLSLSAGSTQWEVSNQVAKANSSGHSETRTEVNFLKSSSTSGSRFVSQGQQTQDDYTDYRFSSRATYNNHASAWETVSGSGFNIASGEGTSSFSGSGTYGSSTTLQTFSGSASASGASTSDYRFRQTFGVVNNELTIIDSSGRTRGSQTSRDLYGGAGTFRDEDNTFSGTTNTTGENRSRASQRIDYQYDSVGEAWTETGGFSTNSFSGGESTNFIGGGSVTTAGSSSGNSTTAVVTTTGLMTSGYSGRVDEQWNTSDKKWEKTYGLISISNTSNENSDIDLSGTISEGEFHGTIEGNIQGSGSDNFYQSMSYSTDSKVWRTSGTGTSAFHDAGSIKVIGATAVSQALPGGSLSGTVSINNINEWDNRSNSSFAFSEQSSSTTSSSSSGSGDGLPGDNGIPTPQGTWLRTYSTFSGDTVDTTIVTTLLAGGFTQTIGDGGEGLSGSITGSVLVTGLDVDTTTNVWQSSQGTNNTISTGPVDSSTQPWQRMSSDSLTTNTSSFSVSVTGGGSVAFLSDDVQAAGTITFQSLDTETSTNKSSALFEHGVWIRGGHGDNRIVNSQGSTTNMTGVFSIDVGPREMSGHVSFHDTNSSLTDYSTGYELNANGSISRFGGGTGHVYNLSTTNMSGSGGYSYAVPGFVTMNGTYNVSNQSRDRSTLDWTDTLSPVNSLGGSEVWRRQTTTGNNNGFTKNSISYSGSASFGSPNPSYINGSFSYGWMTESASSTEDRDYSISRTRLFGQSSDTYSGQSSGSSNSNRLMSYEQNINLPPQQAAGHVTQYTKKLSGNTRSSEDSSITGTVDSQTGAMSYSGTAQSHFKQTDRFNSNSVTEAAANPSSSGDVDVSWTNSDGVRETEVITRGIFDSSGNFKMQFGNSRYSNNEYKSAGYIYSKKVGGDTSSSYLSREEWSISVLLSGTNGNGQWTDYYQRNQNTTQVMSGAGVFSESPLYIIHSAGTLTGTSYNYQGSTYAKQTTIAQERFGQGVENSWIIVFESINFGGVGGGTGPGSQVQIIPGNGYGFSASIDSSSSSNDGPFYQSSSLTGSVSEHNSQNLQSSKLDLEFTQRENGEIIRQVIQSGQSTRQTSLFNRTLTLTAIAENSASFTETTNIDDVQTTYTVDSASNSNRTLTENYHRGSDVQTGSFTQTTIGGSLVNASGNSMASIGVSANTSSGSVSSQPSESDLMLMNAFEIAHQAIDPGWKYFSLGLSRGTEARNTRTKYLGNPGIEGGNVYAWVSVLEQSGIVDSTSVTKMDQWTLEDFEEGLQDHVETSISSGNVSTSSPVGSLASIVSSVQYSQTYNASWNGYSISGTNTYGGHSYTYRGSQYPYGYSYEISDGTWDSSFSGEDSESTGSVELVRTRQDLTDPDSEPIEVKRISGSSFSRSSSGEMSSNNSGYEESAVYSLQDEGWVQDSYHSSASGDSISESFNVYREMHFLLNAQGYSYRAEESGDFDSLPEWAPLRFMVNPFFYNGVAPPYTGLVTPDRSATYESAADLDLLDFTKNTFAPLLSRIYDGSQFLVGVNLVSDVSASDESLHPQLERDTTPTAPERPTTNTNPPDPNTPPDYTPSNADQPAPITPPQPPKTTADKLLDNLKGFERDTLESGADDEEDSDDEVTPIDFMNQPWDPDFVLEAMARLNPTLYEFMLKRMLEFGVSEDLYFHKYAYEQIGDNFSLTFRSSLTNAEVLDLLNTSITTDAVNHYASIVAATQAASQYTEPDFAEKYKDALRRAGKLAGERIETLLTSVIRSLPGGETAYALSKAVNGETSEYILELIEGASNTLLDAKEAVQNPTTQTVGAAAAAAGLAGFRIMRRPRGGPPRLHHSWPKYLGGASKQDLVSIPKSLHDTYHKGLDDVLPRWKGKRHYDKISGAERTEMLNKLRKYTQNFDKKHGTRLWNAMVENGFPIE